MKSWNARVKEMCKTAGERDRDVYGCGVSCTGVSWGSLCSRKKLDENMNGARWVGGRLGGRTNFFVNEETPFARKIRRVFK